MFSFTSLDKCPSRLSISSVAMIKDDGKIVVASPQTKGIIRFNEDSFKSFLDLEDKELSNVTSEVSSFKKFLEALIENRLVEEASTKGPAYKIVRIKAFLDSLPESVKKIILNPPFLPTVNVNERCKCNCPHCYNNTNQNVIQEMDVKTIINNAIKPLANMGCANIMWSGGDPVLTKNKTISLTQAASSLGMSVATQATEFSKDFIEDFVKAGGKGIQFSLFASPSHPEIDDQFRCRQGAWDMSVKNIIEAKKNGLSVFVNMILFRRNMDELEETADFVFDLGVDTFRSSIPVIQGRAKTNKDRLTFSKEEVKKLMIKAIKLKKKYDCKMNVLTDISARTPKETPYSLCSAGLTYLHIAGYNVYPCNFLMEDRFCAGSIHSDTVDKIWRFSSTWQEFRKIEPINEKCISCKKRELFNPICTDCKAMMYMRYGKFFGRETVPCET